jgi:hypothetical protein
MDQEQQSLDELDGVPHHLVIRPRMRMVGLQLGVGLALSCMIAGGLLFFDHGSWPVISVLGIMFGTSVSAHVIWFRRIAPRAIIATDEFLGVIDRRGNQQRIPWSSIFRAVHSTKQLGMQWEMDLIPAGSTILRDIGIDPGRWGLLRTIIIEFAGRQGASVSVDPLSERVYGSGN